MNILCISASNTKLKGKDSASTKVAQLIKDEIGDKHQVNVLPLMDYELRSCHLCGECGKTFKCPYDKNFNEIYDKLADSDVVFFIVPHYSPIPSKLIILLEKINQFNYSTLIQDMKHPIPTKGIKVGIIGHGGMPENEKVLEYYHEHLVAPVAKTLMALGFNVIGPSEEFKYGSVFGVEDQSCYVETDKSIFHDIIQDYDMIRKRIKPHIDKMITNE